MKRYLWSYFLVVFVYYAPLLSAQPAPCSATDGRGIVACVEKAYPEKLVANVTLPERTANAAFLRDRVIETARCAKLDVGHNCKRGNCKSISVDFLAWRNGKITEGVDIIGSWDNLTRPLSLMWHRYTAPNYGHPTYQAYGPVSCVIAPPGPVVPTPTPTPVPPSDVELRLRELSAEVSGIHTQHLILVGLVNTLEQQIASIATSVDAMANWSARVDGQLTEIASRPIPDGCKVQFLSCRLTFNGGQ